MIGTKSTTKELSMLKYVVFIAGLMGVCYACQMQGQRMDSYAIEHNCRWDYNDLCYTQEQRPWLFNEVNND